MSEPKIIKYVTDSTGEELWVQPVSPFTFRGIRARAYERYPDPDDAPYERPMPNAALPGEMIPGRENPEWLKAAQVQARLRTDVISEALIILACDATPNKDVLIKKYANQLNIIRQLAKTPPDEWEATLLHCILLGKNEPGYISEIASDELPLTQDEVVEGVGRFFRLQLQRPSAVKLVG